DARRARRRRAGPRGALHVGGDGAADPSRVRGGARVRLTAVVVHWQDLDDTRGCVASLEPGVDVVVVDNASREPVADVFAGCAMWIRREALAAVGLLDETFFAYHEEVDWCARARAAGWRVVYRPAAVVTHTGRGGAGSAAQIRIRKYFAARNAILYARRHGNLAERAKLAAFLAATLPLELVHHWTHGTADEVWLKMRGM